MITETILGSIIGAGARLAPEIIGALDRKNERAHEREMFKHQLEADRLRAQQQMDMTRLEGDIKLEVGQVDALREALAGQAEMAKAAGGWAAALSASVRPVVTYWLVALYAMAKAAQVYALIAGGAEVHAAVAVAYTTDDHAMLSGILAFWFLSRVYERRH